MKKRPPKKAFQFQVLSAGDCKYWYVHKWERAHVQPHSQQYVKGLKQIKPIMDVLGSRGADSGYLRFLLETRVLTEYPGLDVNRVTSQYRKFGQALNDLITLAKEGLLPGETVEKLNGAWAEFLTGERGKRNLSSILFIESMVLPRRGRPSSQRFAWLAYLISEHLKDRDIQPRWKRTAEILKPFAPRGLMFDEEHIRQLIVKLKGSVAAEHLARVKSSEQEDYQVYRGQPAEE